MATPLIEPLQGIVNGSNVNFQTSRLYVPGSTQVWLDGQMLRSDYADGWTEQGGTNIRFKAAPLTGSVPQIYYLAV